MDLVIFVAAVVLFFALVIGLSFLGVCIEFGEKDGARCEDCRFGYERRGAWRCRLGGRFEGGKCEDFVSRGAAKGGEA